MSSKFDERLAVDAFVRDRPERRLAGLMRAGHVSRLRRPRIDRLPRS